MAKNLGARPIQKTNGDFNWTLHRKNNSQSQTNQHQQTQNDVKKQFGDQAEKKRQKTTPKIFADQTPGILTNFKTEQENMNRLLKKGTLKESQLLQNQTIRYSQKLVNLRIVEDRHSTMEQDGQNTSLVMQHSSKDRLERPNKIGHLQIKTTKRGYVQNVTALQATKKKVSRFVQMFGSSEAAELDLDLTEEIIKSSQDLEKSMRPQTTKAGTLSGDIREMMSSNGFLISPTSASNLPNRRISQLKQPKSQVGLKHNFSRTLQSRGTMQIIAKHKDEHMNYLIAKHQNSFGSESIPQSSLQHKLARNLPDTVRPVKREENTACGIFELTTRTITPSFEKRRGVSAATCNRQNQIANYKPEIMNSLSDRTQFDPTVPAEHNFQNAQTCLSPHPSPYKYLQPRSHVKVPEFLKKHLKVQNSYNTTAQNFFSHEELPQLTSMDLKPAIQISQEPVDSNKNKEGGKEKAKTMIIFQKLNSNTRLTTEPTPAVHAITNPDQSALTFLNTREIEAESIKCEKKGYYSLPIAKKQLNKDIELNVSTILVEESEEEQHAYKESHKIVTTARQLEIRKDPKVVLPVSTDLVPQDLLSKALHKLDHDFQWNKVVEIPLAQTKDENFFTQLHKVDGKAISELYAGLEISKTRGLNQNHFGVGSDHIISAQPQALDRNPTDSSDFSLHLSEHVVVEQKPQFDYDKMLEVVQDTNKDSLADFNRAIAKKIINPMFKLDTRPDVTEVLYKDIMMSYVRDQSVDLFVQRSEDYLDDTKPISFEIERAFNVKITEIKRDLEDQAREAELAELKIQQEKERDRHSSNGYQSQVKIVSQYSSTNKASAVQDNLLSSALSIHKFESLDSSVASTDLDEADLEIRDCQKRRIVFSLIEAASMTNVKVKLQTDFEAIMRLQRKIGKYQEKRIERVLPLIYFDNFEEECLKIKQIIEQRRWEQKPELTLQLTMKDVQGGKKRMTKSGKCLDYLIQTKQFIVQIDDRRYVTSRLCILFDQLEQLEDIEARRVRAMTLQKEAFIRLNIERIFVDEVLKLMLKVRQPARITNNIIRRIGIPLKTLATNAEKKKKVKEMVEQTEALYCYSQVKSVTMSEVEQENKAFACMVTGFKVERNSAKQIPYYGLSAYERNGGPIEHFITKKQAIKFLQNFSMIGRNCFNEEMAFVIEKKIDFLDKIKIFQIPFEESALNYLSKELKETKAQLKSKFKKQPLSTTQLCEAQVIVSNSVRIQLHEKWYLRILSHVEKMIYREFPKVVSINNDAVKAENQLNPFLVRFFKSLACIQGSHLFLKLESELEKYQRFLLSYSQRSVDFKALAEAKGYRFQDIQYKMKNSALFSIQVNIKKKKTRIDSNNKPELTRKGTKLQKIQQLKEKSDQFILICLPIIDQVNNQLLAVLHSILAQFKDFKRIEKVIYPNLKLNNDYVTVSPAINPPSRQNVPTLEVIQSFKKGSDNKNKEARIIPKDNCVTLKHQIEYIIEEIMEQVVDQVKDLQRFTQYTSKTFDSFIFECKQQLYEEMIVSSLTDVSDEEVNSNSGDDLTSERREVKADITSDFVLKEINQIEIQDTQHERILNDLRTAQQDTRENIETLYDFGLIQLDCRNFKAKIENDLKLLISQYEAYLVSVFEKMVTDQAEFNQKISVKVKAEHEGDIDKTIAQMQYIESLQNDDIYGDNIVKLAELNKKINFLDLLYIMYDDPLFKTCDELYKFPGELSKVMVTKYDELQKTTIDIKKKIKSMASQLKIKIIEFIVKFEKFKYVGLLSIDEAKILADVQNSNYLRALILIAEEEKTVGMQVWDKQFVSRWSDRMFELVHAIVEAEQEIRIMNTREEQLNLRTTVFSELLKIKNDFKPLMTLWEVIGQFNELYDDWKTKPLQLIVIEQIEDSIADWVRKITLIGRIPEMNLLKGPMSFVNYIKLKLTFITEYLPLLIALKAKGLEKRHFIEIQNQVGVEINLHRMNLKDLAALNVHKGQVLEKIKLIADHATKEHSIKITLEAVEQDVYTTNITLMAYKDTGSSVIRGIDHDLQTFEECENKVLSVAHSPFAKHFKEKIDKLEKELKEMIAFFGSWKDLQKFWSYLLPIFSQKDISAQMEREYHLFQQIDKNYREIMTWAKDKQITYRNFSLRDNIQNQVIDMTAKLDYLMKCLVKYLEAKRQHFPRMYFLSNEEIIDISGMVDEIYLFQKQLFKMFEGVHELILQFGGSPESKAAEYQKILEAKRNSIQPEGFNTKTIKQLIRKNTNSSGINYSPKDQLLIALKQKKGKSYYQEKKEKLEQMQAKQDGLSTEILGIRNAMGEEIYFNESITVTACIEQWLLELEILMKQGVSEQIRNAVLSHTNEMKANDQGFKIWIQKWPTQFLLISLEIQLTREIQVLFKKYNKKQSTSKIKNRMNSNIQSGLIKSEDENTNKVFIQIKPDLPPISNLFKKISNQINGDIYQLTLMIKYQLNKSNRQKVNSLLISQVYHRDTLETMMTSDINRANNFLLQIFMKYECSMMSEENYRHHLEIVKNKTLDKIHFHTKDNSKIKLAQQKLKVKQNLTRKNSGDFAEHLAFTQASFKQTMGMNMHDPSKFRVAEVEVSIITANRPYGYEFLENSSRLVITPLTERAFQSLFLALQYDYGGAPVGPVGTGKTETIKEMAKRCARNCYVFNCQSGIDVASMSKFFKGLAASGTWTCFDEFNRLEIDVLSIISQLIILIQECKHEKANAILIEGSAIPFERECALFITMNPFFLGRTQLPDNLKALFRNITMVVPDIMFIAEIMLYSSGFILAKVLASKIQRTFILATEQLSNQKHYDFGLRTIKSVLLYAQHLKLRALKVKTNDMLDMEDAKTVLNEYTSLIKPYQPNIIVVNYVRSNNMKQRLLHEEDNASVETLSEGKKFVFTEKEEKDEDGQAHEVKNKSYSKKLTLINVGLDPRIHDFNAVIDHQPKSSQFLNVPGVMQLEEKKLNIPYQTNQWPDSNLTSLLVTEDDGLSSISSAQSVSWDSSGESQMQKRNMLIVDLDYVINVLGCDKEKVYQNEDSLDEFIVLKAILDKNVPKLLAHDTQIFKNILMDVFPSAPSPNFKLNQIQDVAVNLLAEKKMHNGEEYILEILNVYEAIMSRHGVMIVGEAMAGKSKILSTMVEVLNILHQQELKEKIRDFMINKAQGMDVIWRDYDGQIVPKIKDQLLENMLKLKDEELKILKKTCFNKGIDNRILNPKSVSIKKLMGNFEETSREWYDGILTNQMRLAALDKSNRKQLITFDGSIEPDWAENLNSVLDDNMRLTLITGESIHLTPQMTVVLESSDLADTSPATISRCAIIYCRQESLPIKAQFNHWLETLPLILQELTEEIDNYANFFMENIFEHFLNKDYLIYPVSKQWAVSNFIKIFNSLINDYRSTKHRDFKQIGAGKRLTKASKLETQQSFVSRINTFSKSRNFNMPPVAAKRSGQALSNSVANLAARVTPKSSQSNNQLSPHVSLNSNQLVDDNQRFTTNQIQEKFKRSGESNVLKNVRLSRQPTQKSIFSSEMQNKVYSCKPPDYNFRDNDIVFENSIKMKKLWIDSMFLYSLLLSLGSMLTEPGKLKFETFIRNSIEQNAGQPITDSEWSGLEKKIQKNPSKNSNDNSYIPTTNFVCGSIEKMDVHLPDQGSLYEFFFDIQSNEWQSWQAVFQYYVEDKSERAARNIFHTYVNTVDCLKQTFIMERMNACEYPLLMLGPTAVGKSRVLRNYLDHCQNKKLWTYKIVTCSALTDGEHFQANIQSEMFAKGKSIMLPTGGMKLMILIDDINMTKRDKYGIQSCNEIIRQWLDYGGWYNVSPVIFKQIKDICMFATATIKESTKELLTRRFTWHWATIGFQNESGNHIEQIFKYILTRTVMMSWSKQLNQFAFDKIQEATFSFYEQYNRQLKNSPSTFLKRINQRHLLQILNTITNIFPASIRNTDHIAQLWLSEVQRTTLDRYNNGKEKDAVQQLAKSVCHDVFGIHQRLISHDPDTPHYCYCLPEFEEGTYIQMPNDQNKKLQQILADVLVDYNKNHRKSSLDLVIFNTIIEKIVKLNRSLYLQNASTILIAEEGSGSNSIVKMAIHLARSIGQELTQPSMRNSSKEDHRQELKQILIFASAESKHQVVLNVYDADLLMPGLLEDLDALAAHGEMLELFAKEDIDNMLNEKMIVDTSSNREKAKTREQYLEEIRQKCRENFKILLQLTPRSEFATSRLREQIHLVNQACIIQFGDWSRQGFEFIATKYLREEPSAIPLDQPNEVIKQMIDMYYDSKEEAATHFQDTDHFIYIQAQHFENFCFIYREIYKNRMVELTQYKERFSRGLEGIKKTEENTTQIQERLSKEAPKLVEGQRYLEKKFEDYNKRKTIIGLKIKTIFQEEAELNFKFEEAMRINNSCERSLLEMIPILNDAIEGLLLIKKEDIDEIKSYKNPTPTLRTLMQAVCLVLKVPPVITREKENNFKPKEDYWIAALGPQVFGQRKIMHILSTIEPKLLDSETMIQLEKLCEKEELQPAKVQHVCSAALGINKWLRAVRDYYCVYKNSEGRRDKMVLSDIQVQKFQQALEEKRQEIIQLEDSLIILRKKFVKKEEQITQFQQKLEESYTMRSKASRLLNALISEKQKWCVFEAVAMNKLKNIEGDSLMGAGMVCFLAPFSQSIREYLFIKWTKNIEISRIAITKDLIFNLQFGDPLLIKKWIDNQLSNDSYSIQNAIVLQLTQVQTILIDPQGQANKWLRHQIQDVKVINLETLKFMQELTLALKIGSVVLLENVGEQIPRKLYALFKLSKIKYQTGKQKTIIIDNIVCLVHSDFKMFVTSLAKAPDFGSELSLICNFINFSVTPEAFTQQIIYLILQELEYELYETQKLYRRKTLEKLVELKDIEEDILETLRETQGEEQILQEQSLIEKLHESAKLSKVVAKVLAEINQNMKTLLTITALYKSAAVRAKQFFFLANDLTKLNPIYVFTHEWFISIFTDKLKEVDSIKTITQKAEQINQQFTRTFYEKVCLTLFEKDKPLFSFLLAYRVLEIECRFDMRLMEFFIKGPLQETKEVIDVARMADASMDQRKTQQSFETEQKILMRRKKAVPWITNNQWVALDKLSQIAPFNTPNDQTKCRNLSEHIENHPQQWFKWLNGMVTSDYTMHDKRQIEQEEETTNAEPSKEFGDDSRSNASSQDTRKMQSDDAVVLKANQQFLMKRVDTQRMLGLLIPGGYEESNFIQEQVVARKNKAVNDHLVARLAAGQRNLPAIPKKQSFSSQMSLDQIFAHDLDSDNNNTDLEQISEEEDINEGLQKTTVEEDIKIAQIIMDGVAEYTEFFVESSINKKKRFRIQTILTSDLSRLCIMRCFHPEKIMVEIRSFITKFLGSRYIDPPNFDWIPILNSSRKSIPNLIMVGPNVNAYVELKFIIGNVFEFKERTIIYQPVGSLPNENVTQMIISAACQGHWLLFDNLHLQYSLLPNIQKFLEVMIEMHHEINKRIKREAYKFFESSFKKNRKQTRIPAASKENSVSSLEPVNDKRQKNNAEIGNQILSNAQFDDDDEEQIDWSSKKLPETKYATHDQFQARVNSEKRQQRTYILKKLTQIQDEQKDENNQRDKGRELTPEDKAFKDLKFPESFAFPIHKDFRIWLSTIITSDFPTSFARRCNKVTLELPAAIRQNSMKTLSQSQELFEQLKGSHIQIPFRRLFFSMTIMHAVINQREKFGSFGWTQPYSFSPNDINISLQILSSICGRVGTHDKIPIDLLQYCVGQLGYGGNVTNNEDKLTLSSIVTTFIHDRVYTQVKEIGLHDRVYGIRSDGNEINETYDLTGLQYDSMRSLSFDGVKGFTEMEYGREKSYFMPKDISSLTQATEYVRDNFPIIDRPQIFGLHPCAQIKSVKDAGLAIMYKVYVYQFVIKRPKRPIFGNNKFDEKYLLIYEEQRARLIKLQYEIPASFQLKEYVNLSVAREMGMNALIQKEIGLYNILIAAIHENLDETLAAIDGIKQSNDRTDNTFECLQLQRTPREWLKVSYPGNPSLPIYIFNLKQRVKYIKELLEEANKQIKKQSYGTHKFKIKNFWLAGFFDQRNFLTTLMQITTRKKKRSIETAKLTFRFMKKDEALQNYDQCEEKDIYYLNGIWLYGAHWDKDHASLVDMPSQSYHSQALPTLEVKVLFIQEGKHSSRIKTTKQITAASIDLMNSTQMIETGLLDAMDQKVITSRTTQVLNYHYLCPLYVNFQKNRILNKPNEANGQLIVVIPIPIQHNQPEFWVKRSICMLCYNDDDNDD